MTFGCRYIVRQAASKRLHLRKVSQWGKEQSESDAAHRQAVQSAIVRKPAAADALLNRLVRPRSVSVVLLRPIPFDLKFVSLPGCRRDSPRVILPSYHVVAAAAYVRRCVCAHAHAWCGVLVVTRWCCCDAPATTNYIPTPRASCLSCPTTFTRTFNPTTLGATPTTSHAAHCLHWTSSCTCAWRTSCTLQFTRTYNSSTNRHVNSRHIWSHTAQECLVHTLLSAPAMTELAVEVSGSYLHAQSLVALFTPRPSCCHSLR